MVVTSCVTTTTPVLDHVDIEASKDIRIGSSLLKWAMDAHSAILEDGYKALKMEMCTRQPISWLCGIDSFSSSINSSAMSSNSVEKETRDNYYVQTVSMENAPPPPPQMTPYQRTYANPAPLGMLAYGTVILCSSVLTLGAGNVHTPNLVLVFACFYGGISQTLVGMWEMFLGNTFSATVFTTYGGFNFSYGALYLPQIGIAAAYSVDGVPTEEFYHAIGIYLSIWCLITFLFAVGALRTTLPIVCTLGFTVVSLGFLAGNAFTGNTHLATAGGAFGVIAAFGAYYGTMSMFWTQTTTFSFIRLPPLVTAPSNV